MHFPRSSFFVFLLVMLSLLGAFYFPWLSGRQSFYLSDLTYYYEPFCRFIGAALKSNHLPAWNPYLYCGMPQIAVPAPGIFYPPDWLFAFFSFNRALGIYMMLHQAAAGAGAFLLVASLGWGWFAAFVCGISFSLCGYMFSLQKNFSIAATAAWLPLVLWCLKRLAGTSGAALCLQVIFSALSVFAMLSAGRPEIAVPAMLFVAGYLAYSAYRCFSYSNLIRPALALLLWRLTAIFLGVLLCLPAILPALVWIKLSPRAAGLSAHEALTWSSNWYDWLCLVLAQPLGDLNLLGAAFLPLVSTRAHFIPFLSSAYLGPVAITLAFWGASDKSMRFRWVIIASLAAGVLLSSGDATSIMPWLMEHIPLLTIFRYPVKLIIVPTWILAFLAARGAHLASGAGLSRQAWLCSLVAWAILAAAGLAAAIAPQVVLCACPPAWFAGGNLALAQAAAAAIGQSALEAATIGLLVCLLEYLLRHRHISLPVFYAAILSALLSSLLLCACKFAAHGCEPGYFAHDSQLACRIKQLAKDAACKFRVLPLYFDPLVAPASYCGNTPGTTTARFFQYGRQLLLPNTNMDFGVYSSFGYEAAETADYRKIFEDAYVKFKNYCRKPPQTAGRDLEPIWRFCRLTATRYVSTQITTGQARRLPLLDPEFFKLVSENEVFNLRIYEVEKAMPRAYLAGNWQWCDSHEQAMAQIEGSGPGGFDPAGSVILEHRSLYAAQYDPQIVPPGQASLNGSWLKFLQDFPEHVSLSVRTQSPCFVVLCDHFYPGWHASVDGVPAELYRANAVMRAVFVNPGPHLVQFDYDPDSLAVGQKLAGLALVVIGVLLSTALFIKLAESVRSRQG